MLRGVDWLCQRYGQRPSTLLRVVDPLYAYWLDEAAAVIGAEAEAKAWEDREATDGSGSIERIPIPDDFVPW